ncbi:MAG: hypothetical protein AAGF11_14540 [Myxococcota bacterium]
MEFIDRHKVDAPAWLLENAEQWGKEWEERCRSGRRFEWRQSGGHDKHELTKLLSDMTSRHCSYCDAYPMGRRIKETIDHFCPKTTHPRLAYCWDNLFLCCYCCQERNNRFDELLLKPDEPAYDFDDYFYIDWDTGELHPLGKPGERRYERAQITLKLFKLNDNGKPDDRREELEKYEQDQGNAELDLYSYRFYLRRGTKSTPHDQVPTPGASS